VKVRNVIPNKESRAMNPEQPSLMPSIREHLQEARELGTQVQVGLTEPDRDDGADGE
jgi:hypothetical protein